MRAHGQAVLAALLRDVAEQSTWLRPSHIARSAGLTPPPGQRHRNQSGEDTMPHAPDQLAFIGLDCVQPAVSTDRADDPPAPKTITCGPEPDLAAYDLIVAGLSGKDAHAMLDRIVVQARSAGAFDRLFTVHADMGLMEWPSVHHGGRDYPSNRELVAQTALHYGIPAERHIETRRVVIDPDGTRRAQSLLEQIAMWRKFPDAARRWCTSDSKVGKIQVALTPLVNQCRRQLGRPVRILNVTGVRAEESTKRANRPTYSVGYANKHRHQDEYLPVHHLSTAAVRAIVDGSGMAHHWAYDSEPGARDWGGMSRLSCSLCIMSNKADLVLAARRRPRLAALYAEVEHAINHLFKLAMPMSRVLELAAEPGGPEPGVVLEEDGPEFAALDAAVRAQLAGPMSLRASTDFTAVPPGCLSCAAC